MSGEFVTIEDATLRLSEIAYWKWDRGHSYSALEITMRDGKTFRVKDWQGSAYAAETKLVAAVEATTTGQGAA